MSKETSMLATILKCCDGSAKFGLCEMTRHHPSKASEHVPPIQGMEDIPTIHWMSPLRWLADDKHTRVCEIHLSLAGHFVWRTSSPSPDILNSRRTYHCKMSSEYQTFCWTFCLACSNSFAGHFQRRTLLCYDSGVKGQGIT